MSERWRDRSRRAFLVAILSTGGWIVGPGAGSALAAAPVCTPHTHTVESGRPLSLSADCTDSDGPAALSYSVSTWPAHGSLGGDPSTGAATYRSLNGYVGTDSFVYRAYDGAEMSAPTTVTIDVTASSTVNSPPECPSASVFVEAGGSVTVFANCEDADHDPIGYGFAPPFPTGGTATPVFANPPGATYTPNPGTTSDAFGYSANDGFNAPVITVVPITVVTPGETEFESAADTSPTEPAAVSITTTQPGPVIIDQRATTAEPPAGYFLLGQEFDISVPPAADAAHPLVFEFEFDSTVPAGALTVFRNGTAVANCTGAPSAIPNPCVESVTTDGDGDKVIRVLTTHASLWNFGVAEVQDADGDGVADDADNCVSVPNPNQKDADQDGVGAVCDSQEVPKSKDDCKSNGWKAFNGIYKFKNQGDCVSFVASGGKNKPAGRRHRHR